MVSRQYEGLEVEEDVGFERRTWQFQRFGRIALALFILLAFLGFTGSGPLSNASSSTPAHELSVSYERIDRINAPSTFELTFAPGLVVDGELQIWLDSDFVTRVQLESISPEPDRIEIDAGRYIYTFAVTTLNDPAPIAFHFRPERSGISRATIGIVDGPATSLRQIVYP